MSFELFLLYFVSFFSIIATVGFGTFVNKFKLTKTVIQKNSIKQYKDKPPKNDRLNKKLKKSAYRNGK